MKMSIQEKLSVNKFNVDEETPHIVVHADKLDEETIRALTMACPAQLYTLDEKGRLSFDEAGCLECGTCRLICAHRPGGLDWNQPRPSFGVQYRFG